MGDAPKLFDHKPKKAVRQRAKDYSSPSTMASSQSAVTPPAAPKKESFARRYRFLWPVLLTVNLAVGAYLFMRTKNKNTDQEGDVASETPSPAVPVNTAPVSPIATLSPTVPVNPAPVSQIATPTATPVATPTALKVLEPIPEDEQRKVFQWMLEEKRKMKASSPEEKKRIDEDKAILKQFIRSNSIPSF